MKSRSSSSFAPGCRPGSTLPSAPPSVGAPSPPPAASVASLPVPKDFAPRPRHARAVVAAAALIVLPLRPGGEGDQRRLRDGPAAGVVLAGCDRRGRGQTAVVGVVQVQFPAGDRARHLRPHGPAVGEEAVPLLRLELRLPVHVAHGVNPRRLPGGVPVLGDQHRRDQQQGEQDQRRRRNPGRRPLRFHVPDLFQRLRPGRGEQFGGAFQVELRVLRVQPDQELVVRPLAEPREPEPRVRPAGQPVQRQHPEERPERREQDRQLEADRDVRRDAPERLAGDQKVVPLQRGGDHAGRVRQFLAAVEVPLHQQARAAPRQPAAQRDPGQHGGLDAHRLFDAVDRVRREAVPLGEAGVADPLAGGGELLLAGVRRRDPDQPRRAGLVRGGVEPFVEVAQQQFLRRPPARGGGGTGGGVGEVGSACDHDGVSSRRLRCGDRRSRPASRPVHDRSRRAAGGASRSSPRPRRPSGGTGRTAGTA